MVRSPSRTEVQRNTLEVLDQFLDVVSAVEGYSCFGVSFVVLYNTVNRVETGWRKGRVSPPLMG